MQCTNVHVYLFTVNMSNVVQSSDPICQKPTETLDPNASVEQDSIPGN